MVLPNQGPYTLGHHMLPAKMEKDLKAYIKNEINPCTAVLSRNTLFLLSKAFLEFLINGLYR